LLPFLVSLLAGPASLIASFYLARRFYGKSKWIFIVPFISTAIVVLSTAPFWIPDLLAIMRYVPPENIHEVPWDEFNFTGLDFRASVLISFVMFIANSAFTAGLGLYWHFKRKRTKE